MTNDTFYFQKPGSTKAEVTSAAVDTLVWQSFASVIIPGFTINRVCASSLIVLGRTYPNVPIKRRKVIAMAIGLFCIPMIVQPIDELVHKVMDLSIRKCYQTAS